MRYPQQQIDYVSDNNDIVAVVSRYVTLKRRGAVYVGLCPFHTEKTPSFTVNPAKQLFHCFGCNAGGNVFQFVMRREGCGFVDALKTLADNINYTLVAEGSDPAAESAYLEQKKRLVEVHKKAARFFYDMLNSPEGAQAAEYLDSRKVSLQMRRRFGLGFAPSGGSKLYNFLTEQGFEKDLLLKGGLIAEGSGRVYDRFFGRLMFPIFNAYGDVTAFGGRILEKNDKAAKYLNSPETPIFNKSRTLYALNYAKKERSDTLILAEGYMDVIALHSYGFKTAVAALGTAFNENHIKAIGGAVKKIVLVFDSDEAGQTAAARAIDVLRNSDLEVYVVKLQGAKDPDEFLNAFGADEFMKSLSAARPAMRYLLETAKDRHDTGNTDGKVHFAKEAAQILSKSGNASEADIYAREAARMAGIDENALKTEVQKIAAANETNPAEPSPEAAARKPFSNAASQAGQSAKTAGLSEARRVVLRTFAEKTAYDALIMDNLSAEEFCVPVYCRLFELISREKTANADAAINAVRLLNNFQETDEQEAVTNVFSYNISIFGDEQKHIVDYIRIIKIAYCQYMIDNNAGKFDVIGPFSRKKYELSQGNGLRH